MNRLVWLSLWLGLGLASYGQEVGTTYHVQLIRGTSQPVPTEANWKPVGPKLQKRLSPVFRWNYYWEVNRVAVTVDSAKRKRLHLSKDREVEIAPRGEREVEIRVYREGQLIRKCRQAADVKMSIMGGDREKDEAWFVVVRRDAPR